MGPYHCETLGAISLWNNNRGIWSSQNLKYLENLGHHSCFSKTEPKSLEMITYWASILLDTSSGFVYQTMTSKFHLRVCVKKGEKEGSQTDSYKQA